MNNTFTLRKLELAQPLIKQMQDDDPKALAQLAALALADEQTLKLVAAGNTEALQVYVDQAYEMDSEEVAILLGNFISGSQRFKLALSGLKPEEINQLQTKKDEKLRTSLGLVENSQLLPVDSKLP
jgi:hypothetical protein